MDTTQAAEKRKKQARRTMKGLLFGIVIMLIGLAITLGDMAVGMAVAFVGVIITVSSFLLMTKHSKNDMKCREEERAEELRLERLSWADGTWEMPLDVFEEDCAKCKISNIASEANYQKAKLIAETLMDRIGIPKEHQMQYATREKLSQYLAEINRKKQTAAQIETERKIAALRIEEAEMEKEFNRYADCVGREKSICYCNEQIAYNRHVIAQCDAEISRICGNAADIHTKGTQKEHSWAILGGIANGIAGGAAGLAVAIDVERQNQAKRQHNAQLTSDVITLAALETKDFRVRKAGAQSNIESWTRELESAKLLLIDDRNETDLLSKLHLNVLSVENSITGAVKIQIEVNATPDLHIYDNVPAVVDGSVAVLLKIGEKVVGTTVASIGYEGAYKRHNIDCICTSISEQAENYKIEFAPHHLWLVETKHQVVDTRIKAEIERTITKAPQICYDFVAQADKLTLNEIIERAKAEYPCLATANATLVRLEFQHAVEMLMIEEKLTKILVGTDYYYKIK